MGKVIPKCHNVNRFASNLALSSFELGAVEMSSSQRDVTVRVFGETWNYVRLLWRMRKAAHCSFGESSREPLVAPCFR